MGEELGGGSLIHMSGIQLLVERAENRGFMNELQKSFQGGTYPVDAMARMPTLKERLALAVTNAEDQLANAKEAKEIFDRNPDLERLLDLMQKGRF